MKIAGIVAAGTLALTIHGAAAPEDAVDYPADYRQWAHVKSTLVGPQNPGFATNGGLHHFYANPKGMEGIAPEPLRMARCSSTIWSR